MSYILYIFKSFLLVLLLMPSCAQAKSCNKEADSLIVLFHGLANNAASFHTMKQGLEQVFPDVVALTSVEGMKSVNCSIQEQSEMSFNELSTKVEDLGNKSIVLVGHSQGGMRAYAFLTQYGHVLNIKGLVTLASPWEGVPGARVDAGMLSDHLTDSVLNDLRSLSLALGYPKNDLEKQLMLNVQINQTLCLSPGGKDLIEDSAFLREVHNSLPDQQVPILAIGGGGSDFSALLTNRAACRCKALNDIYTFFVVGEKSRNKCHDMQIPLYSQHALNILPKNKKNFKRVLIKDAFHTSHICNIPVPASKAMLSHPRVLKTVIKFAKSILR